MRRLAEVAAEARDRADREAWAFAAVVGHKRKGMTLGRYSAGPLIAQARRCVAELERDRAERFKWGFTKWKVRQLQAAASDLRDGIEGLGPMPAAVADAMAREVADVAARMPRSAFNGEHFEERRRAKMKARRAPRGEPLSFPGKL